VSGLGGVALLGWPRRRTYHHRVSQVKAYLEEVVARAQVVLGSSLIGAYAGGSLALDAYQPGRSDIDAALVTKSPLSREAKSALVSTLRQEALPVPSRGLELVAYTLGVARSGTADPAFELELNTGPNMPFRATLSVADRSVRDGLFWYGLDRSILSQSDGALLGPPARIVFVDLPPEDLRRLLVDALEWWLQKTDAPEDDAVLGACRSLVRFRYGEWVSKLAAGQRLLDNGYEPARVIVAAMRARALGPSGPAGAEARAFQRGVLEELMAPAVVERD
jgi:hypothetical protein